MDEHLIHESDPAPAAQAPRLTTYILGVAASFGSIFALATPALWMALIH